MAAILPKSVQALSQNQGSRLRDALEQEQGAEIDILVANWRYDVIGEIMKKVIRQRGVLNHRLSERIDRLVLNRFLGLPVFLGVMYLMFMLSMNFGRGFNDFFEIMVSTFTVDGATHLLEGMNAPGWAIAVLANGVGGGIATVASFIPVIASLFLFLSVLEDSGYMARAAFVIDRLMRFLGLPGKAFVPLLVGFGCNVPAIMATRTLDSQKDRVVNHRHGAVYVLWCPFAGLCAVCRSVFPGQWSERGIHPLYSGYPGCGLYRTGIEKQFAQCVTSSFILELPNYHLPSAKQVLLRTWDRLKSFVLSAGKVIIMVVLVLNTLSSLGTDGSFGHQDSDSSVLSYVGQSITLVFKPMGMQEDNWPAAVGIFTGMLAKEAFVGTLNAMYSTIANDRQVDAVDKSFDPMAGVEAALASVPANLSELAENVSDPLGMEIGDLSDLKSVAKDQAVEVSTFTVMRSLFPGDAAVIAYLLFILLYTPCVAVVGAIYREAGTGWCLFISGWTLFVGYSVATLYYQLSLLACSACGDIKLGGYLAAVMGVIFR